MTLRLGLIGDPIAHSISPLFQQAALDALGLDARYEAWLTVRSDLPARIAALRAPDILGANVTVPHKQAVLPLLDGVDQLAARAGAVNTIVNDRGQPMGYNTDIGGFSAALRLEGGYEPAGVYAVVLGAGGAARAVVLALIEAGVERLLVLNRTVAKAEELVHELAPGCGAAAPLIGEPATIRKRLAGADLIVNCTAAGMLHGAGDGVSPLPDEAIPLGAFVADIVANPAETPLMRAAAVRGCRTLGGLPMLVRQGALAFEQWTGRDAPIDVMFASARRAMGRTP